MTMGLATALHCACIHGRYLDLIQFLAEQWPEAVKQIKREYRGGIPLMLLLHEGNTTVETVTFLINMWPESVKEKCLEYDETCLLTALKYQNIENVEIILLLIEQWPDAIRIPDKIGRLPLHWALVHGAPLAVLNLMVKTFPASVRVLDRTGHLPLHFALQCTGALDVTGYLEFIKL